MKNLKKILSVLTLIVLVGSDFLTSISYALDDMLEDSVVVQTENEEETENVENEEYNVDEEDTEFAYEDESMEEGLETENSAGDIIEEGTGEVSEIGSGEIEELTEETVEGATGDIIKELTGEVIESTGTGEETVIEEIKYNEEPIIGEKTYNDVTVRVEALTGTFLEGTELVIKPIKWWNLSSLKDKLVEEKEEIKEDTTIVAFDITFKYEGEEVQPKDGEKVKVIFDYSRNEDLVNADRNENQEVKVYHINDETDEGTEIDIVNKDGDEVEILATEFSTYTIVVQRAEETPEGQPTQTRKYGKDYFTISIAKPSSITETGLPEGIIIMDRNLGATATGYGDGASTDSYGYKYQWGNNYGFSDSATVIPIDTCLSWNSNYNHNGYVSKDWINGNNCKNDVWGSNSTDHYDGIWGGENDSIDNRRGAKLTNYEERQGPCPSGWHVPSEGEWGLLINYWGKRMGAQVNKGYDTSLNRDNRLFHLANKFSEFQQYFNLPFAGHRHLNGSIVEDSIGRYWSSSPSVDNTKPASNLYLGSSSVSTSKDLDAPRALGYSIRCFKDDYVVPKTNDVTFEPENGSGATTVQVEDGETTTALNPEPTKDGYAFLGWYLSGAESAFDFTGTAITGDITLYAKWLADFVWYETIDDVDVNVNINAKGGTFPEGTELFIELVSQDRHDEIHTALVNDMGKNLELLAFDIYFMSGGVKQQPTTGVLVKLNYEGNSEFQGASLSDLSLYHIDGTTHELEPIEIVSKNGDEIEFWATEFSEYLFVLQEGEYIVSFVSDDVEVGSGIAVSGNVYTGIIPTPTKDGYNFSGWYLTGAESAFDFSGTAITGDITLYARWQEGEGVMYTVTFDANRGTFVDGVIPNTPTPKSQSISDGSLITQAPTVEFPGYNLTGWWTEPRGGIQWDFANDIVTGNITLYAHWMYGEEYGDLDIYIWKNESTTGHYTFMDRNLGATELYDKVYCNKDDGNSCTTRRDYDSYGYYYQQGNNYGFDSYAENHGALSNGRTGSLNMSSYSWSNPYISSTFAGVGVENWTTNTNLWGGSQSDPSRKQGPCPDGYHIPNQSERTTIRNTWNAGNTRNVIGSIDKDFLMPAASYRQRANTEVPVSDLHHFRYLSSTYRYIFGDENNANLTRIMKIYQEKISNGFSVRCIKDVKNEGSTAILRNIELNGGEKAIISLAEGKVQSLQEPTKSGYVFTGWYTTSDFQLGTKVVEGSPISAGTTLYAHWDINKDDTLTVYTVEHYQQNLAQTGYDFVWSGIMYGTANEQTNATGTNYEGFTLSGNLASYQTGIKADGSTVVGLYYNRDVYTVKFENRNGDVLWSGKVAYGITPEYSGVQPLRPSTEQVAYRFDGWYPEIGPVVSDITYTAVYTESTRLYTVTLTGTPTGYGTLTPELLSKEYGAIIVISGNKLTVGGTEVILTGNEGYEFQEWTGTCGKVDKQVCDEHIIYSHPDPIEFTGGNNLIITNPGYDLFSESNYKKDFEISFDIVDQYLNSSVDQATILNVKDEDEADVWPGFVVRKASGKNQIEFTARGDAGSSNPSIKYNISEVHNVKISRINSVVYISVNGEANRQLFNYSGFHTYFTKPITFGSSYKDSDHLFRPAKVTLSNILIKSVDTCYTGNVYVVTGDCQMTAKYTNGTPSKYAVTGSVAVGQENMGYLSGMGSTGISLTGLYDYATELVFIAIPELGYVFDYWKNGDTVLSGTDLGDGRNQLTVVVDQILDIIAFFKPSENTPYIVEHYKQNLDQTGYEFAWSGTMYGTTDGPTNATGTDYVGFTLSGDLVGYQTGVKADGSTVVRLYYDRDTYTVTWDMWEGHLNRRKTDENVPYGTTPIFEWDDEDKYTPKRGREVDTDDIKYDFIFTGWIKSGSTEIIKDLTTQIVTGNVTYTAQYDTGYRYYEVRYHTDEGTGTMEPQSLQLYSSGTLNKNKFIRTGYDFSGWWYEYGDGIEVFYEDEQEINLGVEDDVIKSDAEWEDPLYLDLYAQWKPNTDTKVTVNYYLKDLDADNNVLTDSTTEYATGVEFTGNTDDVVDILSRYGTGIDGYEYSKSIVYGSDYPSGIETGTTTVLADGSRVIDMYYVPSIYQFILNSATNSSTQGSSESTGYYYGAKVKLSGDSNDDCFEWSGWTTSGVILSDNTLHQTWFTMPANDVEVAPSTTENAYNIIFNGNGSNSGTMSPMNGIRCTESTGLAINTFEKSGHTFTGWYTTQGGIGEYADGAIVDRLSTGADVNLYAVWDINEYNVNASVATGDHGSLQWSGAGIYEFGETLVIIAVPELGYLFDYWEINGKTELPEGATTGENQLTIVVNQILDIVAHFKADVRTVTVNHFQENIGGGYTLHETEDNFTGYVGSEFVASEKEYSGFVASGNNNKTIIISGNDSSNVINLYYERNKPHLHVSLGNGANVQISPSCIGNSNYYNCEYYYDEEISIRVVGGYEEGYSYSGWYNDQEYPLPIGTQLDEYGASFRMPDNDVHLYLDITHNLYKLTFTGYEGSEVTNTDTVSVNLTGVNEVWFDTELELPYLSKPGYDFVGWNEGISNVWGVAYTLDPYHPRWNMPSHDIELTAEFSPRTTMEYTIYYYLQDINGTGYTLDYDLTESKYDGETEQQLPYPFSRRDITGFEYTGFGYDGVAIRPWEEWPTIKATGDNYVNLYYDRKVDSVYVEYDAKKMSVVGTGEYRYGAPVTLTATVKTGYEFSGFTSYQGELLTSGSVYDFTMPDSYVYLYANADPIIYSIEYEMYGGWLTPYQWYKTGYTVDGDFDLDIFDAVKDGYIFLGWTGGEIGVRELTEPTTGLVIPLGSTGNRKYFANFEATGSNITVNYYLKKIDPENNVLTGGSDVYKESVIYTGLTDSVVDIQNLYGTGIEGYSYTTAIVYGSDLSGGVETGTTTILGDQSRVIDIYYTPKKYDFTVIEGPNTTTSGTSNSTGYYLGAYVTLSGNSTDNCFEWEKWGSSSWPEGVENDPHTTFAMPAHNVTVESMVKEKSYNITFDANGGSGTMEILPVQCTSGTLIANSFERDGYTFTGWSRNSGGPVEFTDETDVHRLSTESGGSVTLYAVWDANLYTVTFDLNGGSLTGDMTETKDYTIETSSISLIDYEPERNGYTFTGWYRNNVLVNSIAGGETGDYTLVARWKAQRRPVPVVVYKKMLIPGEWSEYESELMWGWGTVGELYTAPLENFTPTGFHYEEENDSNRRTVVVDPDLRNEVAIFFARNLYPVIIDNAGEGRSSDTSGSSDYLYEEPVTISVTPYTGWEFINWTLIQGTLSGITDWTQRTLSFNMPAEQVMISPILDHIPYTVSFDTASGTTVENQTYYYDDVLSGLNSAITTRTGYNFDGWYLSGVLYTSGSTMPAENITLTAKWAPCTGIQYQVNHRGENTGDNNYGVLLSGYKMYGTSDTQTIAKSEEFAGFTLSGNVEQKIINPNGTTIVDIYYNRNVYTISLDNNGGTGVSEITGKYQSAITQPDDPNRLGYNFAGWDPSIPDTMPLNGGESTAKWNPGLTQYKVNYHIEKVQTGEYDIYTGVYAGETDSSPWIPLLNPSLTGFITPAQFTGKIIPGGTEFDYYYDRDSYMLYYDTAGGTPIPGKSFRYGEKILTGETQRPGYTLIKWNNIPEDGNMPAQSGLTLVALREPDAHTKYTVYHYFESLSGGYVTGEVQPLSGTTDTLTTARPISVPGYKTDFDIGDEEHTGGQVNIDGDGNAHVEIYYDRIVYQIAFDMNGGDAIQGTGVKFGTYIKSFIDSLNPHKKGYAFSGWNPEFPTSMPNHNLTGIAMWTPATGEYKVEFFYQLADGTYSSTATSEELRTGKTEWVGRVKDSDKEPSIAGYAFDSENPGNVLEGQIVGDGSLVLKLYFKKQFTVRYLTGLHGTFSEDVHSNLDYGVGTPVFRGSTGSHDSGYTFLGWDPELTGVVVEDRDYIAQWKADSDTEFKVEYYLQNVEDDGYTFAETGLKTGTTNTTGYADTTKEFTGFIFSGGNQNNITSGLIAGDGSLVLKLYYDRKEYNVTTGEVEHGTMEGGAGSQRYGKRIIFTAHPDAGYVISKWLRDGNEILSGGVIWTGEELEIEVNTGMEIGVEFKAKEDTPYYVEYYKEKLGGGYEVWTGTYSGTTDQEAVAQELSFTGFTFSGGNQSNITSGVIAGDGSLVLKLFYDRNKYTITWKDGNDEVLKTDQLFYGAMPEYTGETPTKIATAQYSYTFNNTWTPAIEIVTTGVTYTAQFDSTVNEYTISIVPSDTDMGTVSPSEINVSYGSTIVESGNIITVGGVEVKATPKSADVQYTYEFDSWTNTCGSELIGTCTIQANFRKILNKYSITWMNDDGSLIDTTMVGYGVIPTHAKPTKTETEEYRYVFVGWDPEVVAVVGDAEYTAVFNAEEKEQTSKGGNMSGGGGRRSGIDNAENSDNQHGSAEENSNLFTGDYYVSSGNVDEETLSLYEWAHENDITTMDTLEYANPDGLLTRGHMAKMVVNFAQNVLGKTIPTEYPDKCNWKDKESERESSEIKEYAKKACALGLMGIYVEEFMPNKVLDRAEFGTIISRLLWGDKYNVIDTDHRGYYEDHLGALKKHGILTQTDNPEERRELRKWVWLVFRRISEKLKK